MTSHQQIRNFNKNLEGNTRNSGKNHIRLEILHPRMFNREIQTRKELMNPMNFRETKDASILSEARAMQKRAS